ncbi:MAG: adenylyltransferase/cytidyltransferase family protein [bacterium]
MNIWVNGCFDILHVGHINLLYYAKQYNIDYTNEIENKVIVGIDSDERIKKLKGDKRPINTLSDRAKMLNSLKVVDTVVSFDNDDELRSLIKRFEVDYMVIGDQYKDKLIIGADCTKNGVIYFPTDKRSTTNIIEKILITYKQ